MTFTKEQLETRVMELKTALDQSVANHNALVGRMNEVTYMLKMLTDVEMGLTTAEMPAEEMTTTEEVVEAA